MGILDDAIREHLELKRRHGASDEELAQQEAEALGPARREPAAAAGAPDDAALTADGPPPPDPEAAASLTGDAPPPPPDPEAAAGLTDDAPPAPPVEAIEPLHAEPSALDPLEPPPGPDPLDDLGPRTEAMPAAELPDDPFDEPAPARRGPGGSVPLGGDDDDPLATPVDPLEAIEPEAADAIVPPDDPAAAAEPAGADPVDDATRVRPLPPLEDDVLPPPPAVPPAAEEPAGAVDDPLSGLDEPTRIRPVPGADDDQTSERRPPDASDDVLEETPDFLQDTPEHDRLWFEQRPPRDFDFDE